MWIVIIIALGIIVWIVVSSSTNKKPKENVKETASSNIQQKPKQSRKPAPPGLPYKKMFLDNKYMNYDYKSFNPSKCEMYDEILKFDGCLTFASYNELVVKYPDGTAFISPLRFSESDMLTTTYIGKYTNGTEFRFLFASETNPMAKIKPMVTFASMSTNGWAVHFRVQ